MSNSLVCKDMITKDHIKGEFSLFYIQHDDTKKNTRKFVFGNVYIGYIPILNNKYSYIIQEQVYVLRKLDRDGGYFSNPLHTGKNIIDFVYNKLNSGEIPKRYLPNVVEHNSKKVFKDKIKYYRSVFPGIKFPFHLNNLSFYEIKFKESIISLIEQKFDCDVSKYVVYVFKKLNQKNGLSFDDYIDKWAKRKLNEYYEVNRMNQETEDKRKRLLEMY